MLTHVDQLCHNCSMLREGPLSHAGGWVEALQLARESWIARKSNNSRTHSTPANAYCRTCTDPLTYTPQP
jgi:hypothetical protein